MNSIIVYDLETGGFFSKDHKNGLAEIAAIAIDPVTLEEQDRFEVLVKPYDNADGNRVVYSDQAFAVNGLSLSLLEEEGEEAEVVAKKFIEWITKIRGSIQAGTRTQKGPKPILAGHNIRKFDNPFLFQFLEIFKIKPSQHFDPFIIDTLDWAKMRWAADDELPNRQLATCCDAIGVEIMGAHRAMPDVEANAELVKNYIRGWRGEGGGAVSKKPKFRESFKF